MKPLNRTEISLVAVIVAFFVLSGATLGWFARTLSTRDQYLLATAELYLAQRDYYDRQAGEIIAESQNTINEQKEKNHARTRRH